MSNLSHLQRSFTSHIRNDEDLDILKTLPYSQEEALERMDIYRNNVIGNLESVLESVYEVTKKLVGCEYFRKLAKEYISQHPSTSANLDDYGKYFSKIIKNSLQEHKLLYLEDIAQLEWLYHESYFKKDIKQDFDIEQFQQLAEDQYESLSFELHPSCILFESKYSIFNIWKSNVEDIEGQNINPDIPQFVIIDRVEIRSAISTLSHEEFLFLSLLEKGCKLFETYEEINRITNKEVDIGSLLNKFISNRVICNFIIN